MRVVVGVTGGVAAFKVASLIRLLTESGNSVKVVPTSNALRFIGATTLEALSHETVEVVDPNLFTDVEQVKHIAVAKNCDVLVVAPATASFIAKLAAGIADDLLLTTVLATRAPVVIAPAMHSEMWHNQATQDNLKTLRARGVIIVEPSVGRLTGEDTGIGRLAEIEDIFAAVVAQVLNKDLSGLRFLITAGGTREHLDPVRFFGNSSSGKQGIAVARAAELRGATVTLICSNVEEALIPVGMKTQFASSAVEMEQKVLDELPNSDVLVMAAAVADYRPEGKSNEKLKRSKLGVEFTIRMVANPDILKGAVETIQARGLDCLTVGFAAEVAPIEANLLAFGKEKLHSKGCDLLVANDVSEGKVFGSEFNRVFILDSFDERVVEGSKELVAQSILDAVRAKLGKI